VVDDEKEMSGVYIHVPFCEQRCYYCAFTVAVSSSEAYAPYIDRLIREIEISGFKDAPRTIYFGGGTPSIVPAAMLGRVLDAFPERPAEVSVEVNPGTLSKEKLSAYRDIGVNRISLGAQSLEDEDLQRAGRLHRAAAVYADYAMLRDSGFQNINMDLIAGLPGQRLEVWVGNLEKALELGPEHVSIYMLEVEERSAWGKHTPEVPADEDYAVFYQEAESRLGSAGYLHYEISNWAKPGFECRHNLGYWTGVPYRGFGVGSHSYDGVRRFWNTASLTEYAECIDAGRLPIAGEEKLTTAMRLEEAFLLGLRQGAGFDIQAVADRVGIQFSPEWFARVHHLKESALVDFDGATLKLTSAGRLVATAVTEELLWPTPSSTFEATP
jgi:oxygen-independent coproporphyrinogen III oxidase